MQIENCKLADGGNGAVGLAERGAERNCKLKIENFKLKIGRGRDRVPRNEGGLLQFTICILQFAMLILHCDHNFPNLLSSRAER